MNKMIRSYKELRKTVGLIGMLLPFVMLFGGLIFKTPFQPSISDYYYTVMGDVFVGALCSVALFLFFYTGYDNTDNILGNIAGFFALGVALFPTSQGDNIDLKGVVHVASAASLFIILALFSYFRFTKGDRKNPQKLKRNIVYRLCGIVMSLAILSLVFYYVFTDKNIEHFVFYMEAVSLFFFGLSWLTKGGDLFFPDIKVRVRPYRRKKYLLSHL